MISNSALMKKSKCHVVLFGPRVSPVLTVLLLLLLLLCSFVSVAMHGFQQFWSDVKFNFTTDMPSRFNQNSDGGALGGFRFVQRNHRDANSASEDFGSVENPDADDSVERDGDDAEQGPGAGTVNVLDCAQVSITLYFDAPSIVPQFDSIEEELKHAPHQGLDISFDCPVTLNYGPWADCQRDMLHKHFLPFDYRHVEAYEPVPGTLRQYTMFNTRIRFQGDVSCRVSYRELSLEEEGGEEFPAWLDILFQGGSNITVYMPWYPVQSSGSSMIIEGHLAQVQVVPSLTGEPFIDATALEIQFDLLWPNRWNALYDWKFNMHFISPSVFFLKDHLRMLTDISSHWVSYGDRIELDWFVPTVYTISISLSDFDWIWNCNENNIVEKFNSPEHNVHMTFRSPHMLLEIRMPWLTHDAPFAEISFNLSMSSTNIYLSMPGHHPMSLLIDNEQSRFCCITKFLMDGSYRYGYRHHVEYRDSIDLAFKVMVGSLAGLMVFANVHACYFF